MSSKSKQKGYNLENQVKKRFLKAGFKCERLGQPNQPDLMLENFGTIECKCYKKGFKSLYRYLGENAGLVIKQQSPKAKGWKTLMVMPLETFIHLMMIKEIGE